MSSGSRIFLSIPFIVLAALAGGMTSTRGAFEVLQTFQRPGTQPLGSLVKLPNGKAYGTASSGGAYGFGSVFRVGPAGNVETLASFTGTGGAAPGNGPTAGVTLGPDGALYGTTSSGGARGFGVIFKITDAGIYTKLVDFTGLNGAAKGSVPGPLLAHSDGFFYGATEAGGAFGKGTIFKVSRSGKLTTLVEFRGKKTGVRRGAEPVGKLVARGTKLYGVTRRGGAGNFGTIFQITTAGNFTDLEDFTGSVGNRLGANPAGGLMVHSDGALYGTTEFGGSKGLGTLFRLTTAKKPTFKTLRTFTDATGSQPVGELVRASATTLLGCCSGGGSLGFGGIFRISTTGAYALMQDFDGEAGLITGAVPRAGLTAGSDGFFHGTTSAGGPANLGTVFKISAGGSFATVARLSPATGWLPSGAPVANGAGGWLFPMATGGAVGGGTLLDWHPSGLSVASPLGGSLGDAPDGSLLEKSGSYYGVTTSGGDLGRGTAFQYTPGTGGGLVNSFSTTAGSLAEGSLREGVDGSLYGIAREGGTSAKGTLFKLTTAGVRTRVLSFTGTSGATPGAKPRGPVVLAANQSFFGVTESGGAANTGVIFTISAAEVYTVIAQFGTTGPRSPLGGLVAAPDGSLYGTTSLGGTADAGTVFRINPTDGSWAVVAEFDGTSAGTPAGELHAAPDGSILGMATTGGTGNSGAVFRYVPAVGLRIIASFTGISGAVPGSASATSDSGLVFTGGLATSADGSIYGTAPGGGVSGGGVFFRIPAATPAPVREPFAKAAAPSPEPLLEYAFGPNAMVSGSPLVPTLSTFENGRSLSLIVPRDPNRTDITITVEASSTLTPPWTPLATSIAGAPFTGAGYVSGETPGGGLKSILIRDTDTTSSAPNRFIRIRVNR